MKPKLLFFSLLGCLLLTSFSCKKKTNSDLLPPPTQTGANTMGCYVNGKPWLPDTRDNGSIPRLPQISIYKYADNTVDIGFNKDRSGANQRIRIYLINFSGTGNYVMDKESDLKGFPPVYGYYENYGAFIDYNSNNIFSTSSLAIGNILITRFDSLNKIISGTFYFAAKTANGLDSVTLSDGRFDCSFN